MVKKTPSKKVKKAVSKVKKASKVAKRLAPEEQVRDREQASGFGAGLTTVYQPVNTLTESQIRDFLMTSLWIDICINTIVDEVIKYPLITQPKDASPVSEFLANPSPKEPSMIVRKKYLKDMLRWGNGCCAIVYKGSTPVSLMPLPGYTLRVTDKDTYKFTKLTGSGFKTKIVGKKEVEIELKWHEVMHFQIDAESDTTTAPRPIEKAYNLILADTFLAKKLSEFLGRGFIKPFFLGLEKAHKSDVKEFVEYVNEMIIEGAKSFGLNKKVSFDEIPHWSASDIIEVHRWLGLAISNIFKVPPFMVNLVQDVGSLNAREQKARFLENVILPILQYEAELYTSVLVRQGFKKEDIKVTSPMIGTKLNYERARIARLLAGTKKMLPILSIDEIREKMFDLSPLGKADAEEAEIEEEVEETEE